MPEKGFDMECPCGGETFDTCCKPFLSKEENPDSALKLMKSRYSAFVIGDVDYIWETHHPDHRSITSKRDIEGWSYSSDWLGLKILDETPTTVEFQAMYEEESGKFKCHHEKAQFQEVDGKWYYTEGEFLAPQQITSSKVGRNDPCPCGSSKKYKKCCG